MEIEEIQQALLKQHKVRVSRAMAEYIGRNLQSPDTRTIPIFAGDARTGVPVRAIIPLDDLRSASQASQ